MPNKLSAFRGNTPETPARRLLTFKEAATYVGLSENYLYKLTAAKAIPHYKPRGKNIYFDPEELENWQRRGKVTPEDGKEVQL